MWDWEGEKERRTERNREFFFFDFLFFLPQSKRRREWGVESFFVVSSFFSCSCLETKRKKGPRELIVGGVLGWPKWWSSPKMTRWISEITWWIFHQKWEERLVRMECKNGLSVFGEENDEMCKLSNNWFWFVICDFFDFLIFDWIFFDFFIIIFFWLFFSFLFF
mgnify:CR=1 FL=1